MQNFYTSIEDAKIEIQKRWKDEELKNEVLSYFGVEFPHIFSEPLAVLVRSIATPDIECASFVELSKKMGLAPVVFEGVSDKFVSLASDKMGLVKLSFFDGYNKNNETLYHYRRIVDIQKNDGRKFSEINTLWGENLVSFHHRLLYKYISKSIHTFDDLAWYENGVGQSTSAKEYYRVLLAFFVVHAVQFENYITDEHEQEFFDQVVQPAFDFIEGKFGVKPLIVELAPHNDADNPYWWCYDKCIEDEILGSMQEK